MKAITSTLYVCGGLMIAAAVLGAVDYSSASKKGALDKLYKEEKNEVKAPPPPKEVDFEDYSRGEINRPVEVAEVKAPERKAIKRAMAKVEKRKKKIELVDFSRKAIRPKIIMEDSVIAKK